MEISNDDKWDQKGGKYTKERLRHALIFFALPRFKIVFSVAVEQLKVNFLEINFLD